MKIAGYLILLFLLIAGATSVFIATKDGSYTVSKSKFIPVSKEILYNYIADSNNWKDYSAWENENSIKNNSLFKNDSLIQILNQKGKESILIWTFKDSLKSTIVTLTTKGTKDFKDKLLNVINKGVDNNFSEIFDESLSKINEILTTEINSFDIKDISFVNRDTVFYIQKLGICKVEDLSKNIKNMVPKLNNLIKSTGTQTNGNPFIIYHSKDSIKKTIQFSVAIPTLKKVFTTSESDIVTGQTNPFQAVKATLVGNYNHKQKALDKIAAFMNKNNLEQSDKHKEIDIIIKNFSTEKSAAKWITEIYIPVRPKKVIYRPKKIIDTLATTVNTVNLPQ